MRILMVCPSYPPQDATCGVGDYTRCLAEELASQGEEVVVVTSERYRGSMDGRVRVVPMFRRWSWEAAFRLAKFSTGLPADIIHFQYTPDLYGRGWGLVWAPLLLRLRARQTAVVVTFHTLIGGGLRSKVMAPYLLAAAHCSISASEEVTDLIHRHLPMFRRRVTEIPIGASIPALPGAALGSKEESRRTLGLADASPLLVNFGLVYPGKGLETVLEALRYILPAHPLARLVIVGDVCEQDRAYRAQLEKLSYGLGVAASIRWMEYQPADVVSTILHAADLFVVPYDHGVSIRRSSLMAGLAQGLPVVSTRSTLPSAYLRDGDNVALVPPRDAAALASRIASLLASPDEAVALGKAALSLAERFSWATIARETRQLYGRVARR